MRKLIAMLIVIPLCVGFAYPINYYNNKPIKCYKAYKICVPCNSIRIGFPYHPLQIPENKQSFRDLSVEQLNTSELE